MAAASNAQHRGSQKSAPNTPLRSASKTDGTAVSLPVVASLLMLTSFLAVKPDSLLPDYSNASCSNYMFQKFRRGLDQYFASDGPPTPGRGQRSS